MRHPVNAAGIFRKRGAYRKRRAPREHFGELVQMDGILHRWLEDRCEGGCMMRMVDDAASDALFWFSKEERTWAAAGLLRKWIERYGIPAALYTVWKTCTCARPRSGSGCAASSR